MPCIIILCFNHSHYSSICLLVWNQHCRHSLQNKLSLVNDSMLICHGGKKSNTAFYNWECLNILLMLTWLKNMFFSYLTLDYNFCCLFYLSFILKTSYAEFHTLLTVLFFVEFSRQEPALFIHIHFFFRKAVGFFLKKQ